jgi:hypothetical protein
MKRLPSLLLCFSLLACGGMEGPPGPVGPRGAPGIPGEDGEDGEDGAGLKEIYRCTGTSGLGGRAFGLNYAKNTFTDGSVLTTCLINDTSTSYGATYLFKASQSGAGSGACIIGYDIDESSEGYWQFTASSSLGIALYVDPTSTFHNTVLNLTCTRH